MRTTRMRTGLMVALTVVAVGAAALGTAAAATALQEGDRSPEGLIDRLVALEGDLPPRLPSEVIISEEETWAEFPGDFTGARVAYDAVADDARQLFIDAEEGEGPVPAAVADAARAILLEREAYDLLAEWKSHDLAFPLDASDSLGVATGADEPYGKAETGLRLMLDANERAVTAYEILRDTDLADAAERSVFEAAYAEARAYESDTRPLIHAAISEQSTQVIRRLDRFDTTAPGTEARARTYRFVCIDREAFVDAEEGAFELPESLVALEQLPAADCPDLDNDNQVTVVGS